MSSPQSTTQVLCPFCSANNPADVRFCVGCGEELKDECPKCRMAITTGDSFCGGCGFSVKDHYQSQVREIEGRIREVEELVVESKFDDAISILSLLSRYSHPRLKETTAQVQKLYALVREKRDAKVNEVLALCDSAKQYAATGLVASAVAEFERVPRHMLPPKAKAMLEQLRFRQSTVETLKKDIKQLRAEKKLLGLLPKIANLLELSGDEEEFRQLGEKVASRLNEEIKKLLLASRYRQAYEVSRELVSPFDKGETEKLAQASRERLGLEHIIKQYLVADKTLFGLIQKLKKLDPRNSNLDQVSTAVSKLLESKTSEPQINVRLRRKTNDSQLSSIQPWRLTGLRSVRFSKPELTATATRYLDVIGLALQAVAEVPLNRNLSESRGSSLFSVFGSKRSKHAWGISIEGTTLKAALLSASSDGKDPRPVVEQLVTIPYTDPEPVEGRLRLCQQNVLSKLLPRLKDTPGDMVIGVSPRKVLPRFFTVPDADQRKLNTVIEMELQHQSPFGKDQVLQRYELFDDTDRHGKRPVMGTILRKTDLEEIQSVFETLGLKPAVFQSTPLALCNLLHLEWLEPEHRLTRNNQGIACLEIGDEVSVFVSTSKRRFWWRYFPLGRRDLVSSVARCMKLTNDQAAKVVANPAVAPRFGSFLDACSEFHEKLLSELQRSQSQAEQFMDGIPLSNLVVGGLEIPFTLEVIRFGTDVLLPWDDSRDFEVENSSLEQEHVG